MSSDSALPPPADDEALAPFEGEKLAPATFFHVESDCVRFWVRVGEGWVGASVSRSTLQHRFRPDGRDEDPLGTHAEHLPQLEAAVRARVGRGSIEPVMLREYDLREGS